MDEHLVYRLLAYARSQKARSENAQVVTEAGASLIGADVRFSSQVGTHQQLIFESSLDHMLDEAGNYLVRVVLNTGGAILNMENAALGNLLVVVVIRVAVDVAKNDVVGLGPVFEKNIDRLERHRAFLNVKGNGRTGYI